MLASGASKKNGFFRSKVVRVLRNLRFCYGFYGFEFFCIRFFTVLKTVIKTVIFFAYGFVYSIKTVNLFGLKIYGFLRFYGFQNRIRFQSLLSILV